MMPAPMRKIMILNICSFPSSVNSPAGPPAPQGVIFIVPYPARFFAPFGLYGMQQFSLENL